MLIAKIENNVVTEVADYRAMFPGTSFPPNGPDADFLAENGCMGVTVFKPHDRATQKLVPAAPYVEGNTVYTVAVEAKTQAELDADAASLAAQVRTERNRRLAATDWTQLADAPVDAAAWGAYRQALRDVTDQAEFPGAVVWPAEPGAHVDQEGEITIQVGSAGPV